MSGSLPRSQQRTVLNSFRCAGGELCFSLSLPLYFFPLPQQVKAWEEHLGQFHLPATVLSTHSSCAHTQPTPSPALLLTGPGRGTAFVAAGSVWSGYKKQVWHTDTFNFLHFNVFPWQKKKIEIMSFLYFFFFKINMENHLSFKKIIKPT